MIYSVKCEENNMIIPESDLAHFVHEVAGQQKPGDVIRGKRLQIAWLAFISSQPHLKCSVSSKHNVQTPIQPAEISSQITFTFMDLSKETYSAFRLYMSFISMCVPWELNPWPFGAANAILYHWATGTDRLSSTLCLCHRTLDLNFLKKWDWIWITVLRSKHSEMLEVKLFMLQIYNHAIQSLHFTFYSSFKHTELQTNHYTTGAHSALYGSMY